VIEATPIVDRTGYQFKVRWVDARPGFAKMVGLQTGWNWASHKFENIPMRQDVSITSVLAYVKLSVSMFIDIGDP
jgi:hypothetical protein